MCADRDTNRGGRNDGATPRVTQYVALYPPAAYGETAADRTDGSADYRTDRSANGSADGRARQGAPDHVADHRRITRRRTAESPAAHDGVGSSFMITTRGEI